MQRFDRHTGMIDEEEKSVPKQTFGLDEGYLKLAACGACVENNGLLKKKIQRLKKKPIGKDETRLDLTRRSRLEFRDHRRQNQLCFRPGSNQKHPICRQICLRDWNVKRRKNKKPVVQLYVGVEEKR